jgi:mannose-1-phosphate guanylyltransferase
MSQAGAPRRAAAASALIIAGGQGTRFWPASRRQRPKPLFSLDGKTTLLADTIGRLPPLITPERIFVLVPAAQAQPFAAALAGTIPAENLLIEPQPRGTAVAIAYGCALIKQRRGEGVVAVMPADHFIHPASRFRVTLARAIGIAARRRAIVVIGVPPTRPDTGYGYQEAGEPIAGGYRVKRFVEKPAPALARKMVKSERFFWNAGMFVMSQASLEAELAAQVPALAAACGRLVKRERGWERRYAGLKFDSFDYELLEKSAHVIGVRANFRWDDVGSWNGLWETQRDRHGNALTGQVLALDSAQVLARANGRLMVLLGVRDLIAIDTDDALLIAHRERTQEVRRVSEALKRRGLAAYL